MPETRAQGGAITGYRMDEPAHRPLWAPWRMEYILSPKGGPCVFCITPELSEAGQVDRHVVYLGTRCFVMLNKYPFASGHLLVLPYVHEPDPTALDAEVYRELFWLVREAAERLRRAVRAEGLNVGMNVGAVAGAGIAEHLHVHIVPRWAGDSNFMPVLADTRVIPQALEKTREHLAAFFADMPAPPGPDAATGKPGEGSGP